MPSFERVSDLGMSFPGPWAKASLPFLQLEDDFMTKTRTNGASDALSDLANDLDALARTAIDAISFDTAFNDLSFGPLAGISRAMRSIEIAEGLTLEAAARHVLSNQPNYRVAQPSARFVLPDDLVAQHGRRSQMRNRYAPDLIVLNTDRAHLVIAEFKRSGSSINNAEIRTIKAKLEAIAPLVIAELKRGHDAIDIAAIDLAVVDCAGRDRRSALVDLGLFGELLGHPQFETLMVHFRKCFGIHAQRALRNEFGIQLTDPYPVLPDDDVLEPLIRFYERPAQPGGGGR